MTFNTKLPVNKEIHKNMMQCRNPCCSYIFLGSYKNTNLYYLKGTRKNRVPEVHVTVFTINSKYKTFYLDLEYVETNLNRDMEISYYEGFCSYDLLLESFKEAYYRVKEKAFIEGV